MVEAKWKLVPVDATADMIAAAMKVDWSNEDEEGTAHNVWYAMTAASPAPALPESGVDLNIIARRMQRAGASGTEEELEAALAAALAIPAPAPAPADAHEAYYEAWKQEFAGKLKAAYAPAPAPAEQRIAELEAALRPFAKVAGPINGEEGRISYLDAMIGKVDTDELSLCCPVGERGDGVEMSAEDFRRARRTLQGR